MTRAENKEQYKEYDKTYYMKHRRPKTKIGQAEQRIADLEAKLAESEEEIKQWKDGTIVVKLCELEKQVEDKDKEIETIKQVVAEKEELIVFADRTIKGLVLAKEIDKISFCIEKLEKVKEELEFTSNNNEWITARDDRILNGICDFIDNQIEELKKEINNG